MYMTHIRKVETITGHLFRRLFLTPYFFEEISSLKTPQKLTSQSDTSDFGSHFLQFFQKPITNLFLKKYWFRKADQWEHCNYLWNDTFSISLRHFGDEIDCRSALFQDYILKVKLVFYFYVSYFYSDFYANSTK